MPLVQDKQGRVYEELGRGMLRPVSQEELDTMGQNPIETFGNALAVSAAQAVKGGQAILGNEQAARDLQIAQRMQEGMGRENPVSAFLGQAAPGALVAAGTAGAGLPAMMGAEAALGAAYSPQNPLMGAAIGAAIPGAAAAAPVVAGGIRSMVGAGTQRMPGRVAANIDAAAPAAREGTEGGAYLYGLSTPEELAAQGVRLSPGMESMLRSTNKAEFDAAQTSRFLEDLRAADPILGMASRETKDSVQAAVMNLVRREAGEGREIAFTPRAIGENLSRAGSRIDEIMKSTGGIGMQADELTAMKGIVERAGSDFAPQLQKIVNDIEQKVAAGGGMLDPANYQNINARITQAIKDGMVDPKNGGLKVQLFGEVQDIVQDALARALPDASREALSQARYQYRILKTLAKGRAVNPTGEINFPTFYANWTRGTSDKVKGLSEMDKLLATAQAVTAPVAHTGSTLHRVISGTMAAPTKPALGAAGGLGAMGGLGALFG